MRPLSVPPDQDRPSGKEERMRRKLKTLIAAVAVGAVVLVPAGTAMADDHLFNAASSQGVEQRGFANPVAENPSGTSGAAAQPGTVPGLGDPKSGTDTGTPAFDAESLCERLEARSSGAGPGC
jgi:hypothetical protein